MVDTSPYGIMKMLSEFMMTPFVGSKFAYAFYRNVQCSDGIPNATED